MARKRNNRDAAGEPADQAQGGPAGAALPGGDGDRKGKDAGRGGIRAGVKGQKPKPGGGAGGRIPETGFAAPEAAPLPSDAPPPEAIAAALEPVLGPAIVAADALGAGSLGRVDGLDAPSPAAAAGDVSDRALTPAAAAPEPVMTDAGTAASDPQPPVPPADAAAPAATRPAAAAPQPAGAGPAAPPVRPADQTAAANDDALTAAANPLAVPGLSERLAENIERIERLGHRLLAALAARPTYSPAVEGPGPDIYSSVAQAWLRLAAEQPARIIQQQVRYWGETINHVAAAQEAFARNLSAPQAEAPADRRFRNPLWQTNPFFSFVRNQYQINADAMRQAVADLSIEDETDRRRIDWFTRQLIDMLAPTNFLATNPDALQRAIETEGESLVKGLENLVRDVERGGGDLIVSLSDPAAFEVGGNIGTTPGRVVHRTDLFELIQFTPTTDQVRQTPLVVFPPWINKYYILDLKPQNSLLRWVVEQGYTLFVVSWKNPGAEHAALGMDDYVAAFLEVVAKVTELTGERQLNAVGYCIAGTTLSATLALMHQKGDDRIKSATLLTTLTDFSDQGEFTTFLQDDFVGGIEDEVSRVGYLSSQLMQRTFSFLRANDLVWGPAIRSYMMGEAPPAFDLLYWNADGTNLPGRMVTQYLRDLCQSNALADAGFDILGHRVHLSEVTLPIFAVACERDHIAPWLHSWAGVKQMGSPDKTFVLSQSGHVAGIINPPGSVKYGHYTSGAGYDRGPDAWRADAVFQQGSWWPTWAQWLASHSGEMVPARMPMEGSGAAPGLYVLEKAS